MFEYKRNLSKTYEKLSLSFNSGLDQSNKIYYGLLNLIVTLSSSSLLISIALAEKFFPVLNQGKFIPPILLVLSWMLLTISIIFGIIAELEDAIFHGNQARKKANVLRDIKKKISQGVDEDLCREEDDESYIILNTIIWGAISINSYILALLFMCLALLEKFTSMVFIIIILVVIILSLVRLNFYLINKRNNIGK